MTKILVIEDDSFLVDAYSTKLQKAGYKVVLATNGEEGLTQAATTKPDIILLDLLLPKKNGFDVLADLKTDKKLKKIPVIVTSNLGQEKDIEQVRQLGADDYLIKANVSMKAIIEKVEKVLGNKSSKKKRHHEESEITIKEVDHHKKHKKIKHHDQQDKEGIDQKAKHHKKVKHHHKHHEEDETSQPVKKHSKIKGMKDKLIKKIGLKHKKKHSKRIVEEE